MILQPPIKFSDYDDDKQQNMSNGRKEKTNRPRRIQLANAMYEKRKYQQFKIKCCFCVVRLRDETLDEEHEYFKFESRAKKGTRITRKVNGRK